MLKNSSTFRSLAGYTWIAVAIAAPAVSAQPFTTIINVPPDVAPSELTSGIQLNLFDGGKIRFSTEAYAGSELNMTGGVVPGYFSALSGSTVNIRGGYIDSYFASVPGSSVTVYGGAFQMDGIPISGFGSIGATAGVNVPDGSILTALLEDGKLLTLSNENSYRIKDGTLTLVATPLPTPTPSVFNVPADPAPSRLLPGQTLNLGNGGNLDDYFTLSGANLNLSGGTFDYGLMARDSLITVTDGSLGNYVKLLSGTTLNVSGGQVEDHLTAMPDSIVHISGGFVDEHMRISYGAVVNVSGGEVDDDYDVEPGGTLNITGGNVSWGETYGSGSTINISGGDAGGPSASSGGVVNISDGTVHGPVADTDGTLNITGGTITHGLRARSGGTINLRGGTFGDFSGINDGSSLNIYGSDFQLNGVPVAGLNSPGNAAPISSLHYGILSGILEDGTPFILHSRLGDNWVNDDTVTVIESVVPPAGPSVINVPASPAPQGLRAGQTLNLSPGGLIGDDFDMIGGTLNITGGTVGDNLEVMDANVTLSGGQVGWGFDVFMGSIVLIEDGTVGSGLTIHSDGYLRMTGGTVDGSLSIGNYSGTSQSALVDIEGGTIDSTIRVNHGGTLNMSGGSVGSYFSARSGSTINLIGQTFILDGVDITASLTPNIPLLITDRDVMLTGILGDGSSFDYFLSTSGGGGDALPIDATLTITLAGLLLPGDLNADGFVGIEDLSIVLSAWNANVVPGDLSAGDPTGDGFVGIEDLNVVLGNWNTGTPPLEVLAAIPEPASGAMILLGVMLGSLHRKRA